MTRLLGILFAMPLAAAAPAPLSIVLQSRVDTSAADRFAQVWNATEGAPSAADLQRGYLRQGDQAIAIFTPGRIRSADHLAKVIASNPKAYGDAVQRCLPWVRSQDARFRSVNLGLRGLLPNRQPPKVAIVVGAGNSGGTAGEGMQVIGLEVICRMSPDRASFDALMRNFFAHEAVHTFQRFSAPKADADWLLSQVIREGTADYVASLVTGTNPSPERSAWAKARGDAVWTDFLADRATSIANMKSPGDFNDVGTRAVYRWVMNSGSAPKGWPGEAGYWVGAEIARAYVEASSDPQAALEELLVFDDPEPILRRAASRIPSLKAALARTGRDLG